MKPILIGAVLGAVALLLPVASQVVETPIPGDPCRSTGGRLGKSSVFRGEGLPGIPFAAPPLRELRWREPQPVKPWKGVYHADRKMPECMQVLRPHNINHYFGEEATSEDCLYMNIWAPPSAKSGRDCL